MNVGIILARGRGSSLPLKNIYPLNGVPMLSHFLAEMRHSKHLDKLFVWTESREVAVVAESYGAVVLERPQEMVHYHSGFYSTNDWHRFIRMQIVAEAGEPDVIAFLNCNHVLLTRRTIDEMFGLLLKEQNVAQILAVAGVDPGIVIKNEISGFVFPLFPSLDGIVRKVGISLSRNGGKETRFFPLNWEESMDIQNAADIPFAEFCLRRRQGTLSL